MIVRQSGGPCGAEAPRRAAMHGETSERGFCVFIAQPGRAGMEGTARMLDRLTHTERHPLNAGTPPRARRERCAPAPWGDVRRIDGRVTLRQHFMAFSSPNTRWGASTPRAECWPKVLDRRCR